MDASLNPALAEARYCPRCGHRGFAPGRGLWTFPGGFVDRGESVEVRAFAPADIPWEELAFWSTERALRDAFPGAR